MSTLSQWSKWSKMVKMVKNYQNGIKWSKIVQIGPSGQKLLLCTYNDPLSKVLNGLVFICFQMKQPWTFYCWQHWMRDGVENKSIQSLKVLSLSFPLSLLTSWLVLSDKRPSTRGKSCSKFFFSKSRMLALAADNSMYYLHLYQMLLLHHHKVD